MSIVLFFLLWHKCTCISVLLFCYYYNALQTTRLWSGTQVGDGSQVYLQTLFWEHHEFKLSMSGPLQVWQSSDKNTLKMMYEPRSESFSKYCSRWVSYLNGLLYRTKDLMLCYHKSIFPWQRHCNLIIMLFSFCKYKVQPCLLSNLYGQTSFLSQGICHVIQRSIV